MIHSVQFSSVPWPIRSPVGGGEGGDIWDDSAEILFQSFLLDALVSSSGMGRDVHSLMLSLHTTVTSTLKGAQEDGFGEAVAHAMQVSVSWSILGQVKGDLKVQLGVPQDKDKASWKSYLNDHKEKAFLMSYREYRSTSRWKWKCTSEKATWKLCWKYTQKRAKSDKFSLWKHERGERRPKRPAWRTSEVCNTNIGLFWSLNSNEYNSVTE